jgi:hypothetical protein
LRFKIGAAEVSGGVECRRGRADARISPTTLRTWDRRYGLFGLGWFGVAFAEILVLWPTIAALN